MMRRYLTLGTIPELRIDPVAAESEIPGIELNITVDKYWQLQDIIEKIRYERLSGFSGKKHWQKLLTLIRPYIAHEKERNWLGKN